ncbi:hypothetical protein [Pelotalea chapellei]|uniref:General secretion pathway protein B n=1 Tax=Pelotalea chapellei TaxID=44671 RepID=A0ABS5U9M4_9BACT|nr:hypothetical protein [Pelotalea chapellei]MBT1072338.1 hypothetical protein [Pelotalea chapellei]
MSYILDALKKTEREKARKERHAGRASLSGELFNDDLSHRGTSNNVRILIVVILASLVTFGVTWYLLKEKKGHKVPSLPVASQALPPSSPPISSMLPVPASSPVPLPATPPVTSAPTQAVAPSGPVPPGVQPAQNALPPAATEEMDEGEGRGRRRSRAARNSETVPSSPIQQQNPTQQQNNLTQDNISAPGDIKVSGIAWQDERRARRAVVNGFLLHEGSVVSGARITEIQQDRVRFSQNGKTFDISLVSAGMPLNK